MEQPNLQNESPGCIGCVAVVGWVVLAPTISIIITVIMEKSDFVYFWEITVFYWLIILSLVGVQKLWPRLNRKYDRTQAILKGRECYNIFENLLLGQALDKAIKNLFDLQDAVLGKNPFISRDNRAEIKQVVNAGITLLDSEMERLLVMGRMNVGDTPEQKAKLLKDIQYHINKIETIANATSDARIALWQLTSKGSADSAATKMLSKKVSDLKLVLGIDAIKNNNFLVNITFEGFTELLEQNEDKSKRRQLSLNYQIDSVDNSALWQFFRPRKREFEDIVRNTITYCTKGELEVIKIDIEPSGNRAIVILIFVSSAIKDKQKSTVVVTELSDRLLKECEQFFASFSSNSRIAGRRMASLLKELLALLGLNKKQRS